MEIEQFNLENSQNNIAPSTANNFWPQIKRKIEEIKEISNSPASCKNPDNKIARKIQSIQNNQYRLDQFTNTNAKEPLIADLFGLDEKSVDDYLPDTNENFEEKICDKLSINNILSSIESLTDTRGEKDEIGINIIKSYFGLDGYKKKSKKQIAEEYGLSKGRIHQIIEHRLKKLKYLINKNFDNQTVKKPAIQPNTKNTKNETLSNWHIVKLGYIWKKNK